MLEPKDVTPEMLDKRREIIARMVTDDHRGPSEREYFAAGVNAYLATTPEPAPVLTEEERAAIKFFVFEESYAPNDITDDGIAALRGLLARTERKATPGPQKGPASLSRVKAQHAQVLASLDADSTARRAEITKATNHHKESDDAT